MHTVEQGMIKGIKQLPSPNFDDRPEGLEAEVLIIHSISLPPGEFGGSYIEDLFCNRLDGADHPYFKDICSLEVSAHLLIKRTGEVLQFVSLDKRAWHAGESECEGRSGVNDFSIGIELEGCDDQPFEAAQYDELIDLTRALMVQCPAFLPERIYGHSEISPGRKTDPGPEFDWQRYRSGLPE